MIHNLLLEIMAVQTRGIIANTIGENRKGDAVWTYESLWLA